MYSPFPEEVNRVLTGHLTSVHFAPTQRNADNPDPGRIDPEKIIITGNTVIDALLEVADRPYEFEDETLKHIDFENKEGHRRDLSPAGESGRTHA